MNYIKSNILKENPEKAKADLKNVSMNIPKSDKPRVVVIGGGFAGIEMIKKLAKTGEFQIVLLDRNNYHTFQPLLYQVATSGLEPDSIAEPLRKIFSGYKNFYFRMANVDRVHPEENCISTSIGRLEYDYLVIATGSKTNYYGNDEVMKNSFPMKQVPQSLDLRSKILQNFEAALLSDSKEEMNSLLDIVIVGGGPTGVELAGALAELRKHVLPKDIPEIDFSKMDIYLLEAAPRLLNGMSQNAHEKAAKYLEDFGVKLILENAVKSYDGYTVKLNDGTEIITQTLIWAAGVQGNIIEGMPGNSVKASRYVVDHALKVEGAENIFAVGDVAGLYTEATPKGFPMVAQVAIQQGKHVANTIIKMKNKEKPSPFKYNDKGSMATIGRNRAVVDLPKFKFAGMFAWFVWMFVHLLFLIGFRNKITVFVGWVWNYFTFDRTTRLIIRPWDKARHKPKE